MGNTCCNKDSVDKRFDLDGKDAKAKPGKREADPEMEKIMDEARKNEDKIVKLQAHWKGHQTRKQIKDGMEDKKNKPRQSARLSQRNKDGN